MGPAGVYSMKRKRIKLCKLFDVRISRVRPYATSTLTLTS